MRETILIELDEATFLKKIDEVEKWFEHVLTAQPTLEVLLNKTIPTIVEPHIKEALEKIQQAEPHHSISVEDLFHVIKRTPDAAKDRVLGTVLSKVEEGTAQLSRFDRRSFRFLAGASPFIASKPAGYGGICCCRAAWPGTWH